MSKSNSKNVLEVKHGTGEKAPERIIENLEQKLQVKPITVDRHSVSDAYLIAEAIRNKTTVLDLKKNKKYAFTQTGIVEITERDIKAIEMTVYQEVEKFEKALKYGFTSYDVETILIKIESVHAAYLESDKIDHLINRLNNVLSEQIKNGSDEERRLIRQGISIFFEKSLSTISRETRKFNDGKVTLNNREEKEYFRNDFISKMLKAGVVDYSQLVEGGIITGLDFMTLDEVFRELNVLTNEEFENACYLTGSFESRNAILNYYAEKDKRFFAKFASIEEIVQYLKEEKIEAKTVLKRLKKEELKNLTPDDLESLLRYGAFPKGIEFLDFIQTQHGTERVLRTDFLTSLNREQFMKIVMSDQIKYKNSLESNDYINMFGTLKIEDIEFFINNGAINVEDVLKLTKFKSLKYQESEEYEKMIELIQRTYTPEVLEKLLNDGKINKRFVEDFNKFLNNDLSKEQKDEYLNVYKESITSQEKEIVLVLLSKNGIDFSGLNYEVATDVIEDLYIEEAISEEEILNLFKNKLISLETVKEIFTSDEIIQHYKNGTLSYEVLNLTENRADVIRKELLSGKIGPSELMVLYSNQDGIDIDEFLKIVQNYEIEIELADFITDGISLDKVEDLFKNYYISQDELSTLVQRNIITEENAKEFAENIATNEAYESIFNSDNGIIILTEETPEGESTTKGLRIAGTRRESKLKIDPDLQELLLEQIGFDARKPVLKGTNNSLDGYRIYPSKELELMVFMKNDKPGNATYIMSLQQGLFFLNKMARNGNLETKVIESDATKQGLRETEHVKVRNASAGWGKNVVYEMKKLSPEFAKKVKVDSEYSLAIDTLVEDIKTDYEERKNEIR